MTTLAHQPLKADIAKEKILDWIRVGELGPGDRLQSERKLAERLSMNTRTVRRALAELEAEGVIEKRPRAGNFVRAAARRDLTTSVAVAFPTYCRDDHGSHPTVGSILTGISESIEQRDHPLSTYWYRPGRFWVDAGQAIVESGAVGLLLYPHGTLVRQDIERLREKDIDITLLAESSCRFLEEMPIPGVKQDMASGYAHAFERLLGTGHRRIAVGVYTQSPHREAVLDMLRGCRAQFPELPPMRDLVFDVPNDQRVDTRILPLVLERRPRPTAVLVNDDMLAGALFRLCYRHQLRVPEDLSIAAVFDNSMGTHPVKLVAARGSAALVETGRVAADILHRQISGDVVDSSPRTIQLEIQDGESIGPPVQD